MQSREIWGVFKQEVQCRRQRSTPGTEGVMALENREENQLLCSASIVFRPVMLDPTLVEKL